MSPKPPRSPKVSSNSTSPKVDSLLLSSNRSPTPTEGWGREMSKERVSPRAQQLASQSHHLPSPTLLERRGKKPPLNLTSPGVGGGSQSEPSSVGSTSSKRRSAGAGSAGKGGQLNVGEDSWGAASSAAAEEALARVKQLEEQTALAEHKRRAAEERALVLSSQSAQLMKSKEENTASNVH